VCVAPVLCYVTDKYYTLGEVKVWFHSFSSTLWASASAPSLLVRTFQYPLVKRLGECHKSDPFWAPGIKATILWLSLPTFSKAIGC